MAVFTPSQKLDNVLALLSKDGNPCFEALESIATGMTRQDKYETYLILNKLIKDGYVEFSDHIRNDTTKEMNGPVRKYIISFEGLDFLLNRGGYQELERIRVKSDQTHDLLLSHEESIKADQIKRDESLKKLTRWIAVGTIIAGIYYLLETVRLIFPLFYRR
jgi:hypothetical protein